MTNDEIIRDLPADRNGLPIWIGGECRVFDGPQSGSDNRGKVYSTTIDYRSEVSCGIHFRNNEKWVISSRQISMILDTKEGRCTPEQAETIVCQLPMSKDLRPLRVGGKVPITANVRPGMTDYAMIIDIRKETDNKFICRIRTKNGEEWERIASGILVTPPEEIFGPQAFAGVPSPPLLLAMRALQIFRGFNGKDPILPEYTKESGTLDDKMIKLAKDYKRLCEWVEGTSAKYEEKRRKLEEFLALNPDEAYQPPIQEPDTHPSLTAYERNR